MKDVFISDVFLRVIIIFLNNKQIFLSKINLKCGYIAILVIDFTYIFYLFNIYALAL